AHGAPSRAPRFHLRWRRSPTRRTVNSLRTMRRALLLVAAAGLLAAAAAPPPAKRAAPSATARPDLVLVTIDTLRADAPGFAGNSPSPTPLLDRLAARGRVYTGAHAHNVVTLPSHTNILTGLYPYQHGVRDNAGFR